MFYNARYYSPLLGRFISADTIVPGAGNPQAFNRYAYVSNNPLKYTDPSGHRRDESGCQTQGCATDEDWALNILKTVAATTDFSNPEDNPIGQMALGFFQDTVNGYTPEAGPMTLGDAARDAWHGAHTFVRASHQSTAAGALATQRAGRIFFTLFVVSAAGMSADLMKARGYEYIDGYLSSLTGRPSVGSILMPGGKPIGTKTRGNERYRTLQTEQEMRDLFDSLKTDAKPYVPKNPYDGELYRLPDGGTVGWRNTSKSGGPAIEINIPGIPIDKIHLP